MHIYIYIYAACGSLRQLAEACGSWQERLQERLCLVLLPSLVAAITPSQAAQGASAAAVTHLELTMRPLA